MLRIRAAVRSCAFIAALVVAFLSLFSCGVESGVEQSSETEENTLRINGYLVSADGQPLAEVSVINLESGQSAISDESGAFTMLIPSGAAASFLLETSNFSIVTPAIALNTSVSQVSVAVTIHADFLSADAEIVDGGMPSPQPTQPPDSVSDYDADGNTTSFGIPAGIIGNAHEGKREWAARCQSCHPSLEGTTLSFAQLKRVIGASPMFITLPDPALADLVAYLHFRNRSGWGAQSAQGG